MMAEAIARGLLRSGVQAEKITAYDTNEQRLSTFCSDLGVHQSACSTAVVESSDTIIIAVKPFVVSDVLAEIGSKVGVHQLVISIAAGITIGCIENELDTGVPVIRVMPNTPCLVGDGATAIAPGRDADASHLATARMIFDAVGEVVEVTEDKIDAVTGLSGSGPAYVYTFIEALTDGGVRMGLPRATARLLAAQTVYGAAKMVLDCDDHPAELRDRVTTPGGTTIAGLAALEASGFRSAVMEAVKAATERSVELGKVTR